MTLPDEPHGDQPTFHRALLLAVLVLAVVLRVWSIDFGLPHTLARPDETEIVGRAVRFFGWDLNPRFFHYPSLFFYLLGALYGVRLGGLALTGHPLNESLAAAALDLSPYIVMARWVSAFAGVATVGVVYLLGRIIAGPRAGLVAALFLAVSPLHVRDSHFATTDVLLTLFVALAAFFVVRVYREGRWQDFALAGACAGLAMGTKYVGLLMPGAIGVAYLLSLDTTELSTPGRRAAFIARDRRPWIFAVAWVGAFLGTTPYAVLDYPLFTRHFLFQLDHLSGGHGLDLGIGGVYHLRYTLPLGVGWPVFLTALAGVGTALRSGWREALVLLAFPLLFYASTFSSQTLFLRYMMPVIPFVCLFAGLGTISAVDRFVTEQRRALAVGVLLTVLTSAALVRDVTMNRLLAGVDSRVIAADWLVASAPPGVHSIYQTGDQWGHLEVPRNVGYYDETVGRLRVPAITPARQVGRDYERMQAEARREHARVQPSTFQYMDSINIEAGARPDYIVRLDSELVQYTRVRPRVERLLSEEYEVVHQVAGAAPGQGWYDQHDAFFLPFTGFRGATRPGPNVTIFRRRNPQALR